MKGERMSRLGDGSILRRGRGGTGGMLSLTAVGPLGAAAEERLGRGGMVGVAMIAGQSDAISEDDLE